MARRIRPREENSWGGATDVQLVCTSTIRLLFEAHEQSEPGNDPWQVAVPLAELCATGITRTELRRLIHAGLVEFRVEITTARSKRRRFRVWHNHALPEGSCFLLTELGIAAARHAGCGPRPAPNRPRWDGERLWWGDVEIKSPAKRARSQRLVLAECERCGWTNPINLRTIVPVGVDRNHWALNTARNLNHGLKRIRFHADGSKHAVTWERWSS